MSQPDERLPPSDRLALISIAAGSLLLRAIAYLRYRFDSDEPQHLHVAWGWTAGLVQYRDYFDNHAPLFHMATAPVLKMLGERPDILLYMRALMLPLWLLVLASAWIVARRFWSRQVALWSVVMLSLFPPFFLKSLEYRTDNGWNAIWALAIIVYTARRYHTGEVPESSGMRIFWTGVILGAALCVSMKTPLLVVAMVAAELATAFARREPFQWGDRFSKGLQFAAGFVIVPSLLIAFFVSRGAWPNLLYCVVTFNELIARTHGNQFWKRLLYPLGIVALLLYTRRRAERENLARPYDRERFFLGMFCSIYLLTLGAFWVLISPRDMLPVMPLAAIFTSSLVIDRLRQRALVFGALALIFLLALVHNTARFSNRTAEHITMMRQVLALTHPGEPLMDLKGETVYRPRPFYYIFETITREAMRTGLIADSVADSVVRAQCHVVQADGPFFPRAARVFLRENFLDVGRLRASGQWIRSDGSFSIAVPGDYVVIDANGLASGTLDGVVPRQSTRLESGSHRFVSGRPGHFAILWAPAFARGFSPFHLRDLDFPRG